LTSATRQIVEAGVELNAWQFNLLAAARKAGTIKAGSYEVAAASRRSPCSTS